MHPKDNVSWLEEKKLFNLMISLEIISWLGMKSGAFVQRPGFQPRSDLISNFKATLRLNLHCELLAEIARNLWP